MRWHNWHLIGWAIIIVMFIGWEVIALMNKTDAAHPFTWYVRRAVSIEPIWFLAAGFLIWLFYHFLIDH